MTNAFSKIARPKKVIPPRFQISSIVHSKPQTCSACKKS